MIKIDNYYKFIGATFGLAYFIGLSIALLYILFGATFPISESFTSSLHLTNQVYFKTTFLDMSSTCFNLAILPFSYLITAVNYGFSHMVLLTSSFLGQIKLIVQLLPELFFFFSFIIFSTIGIKIFAHIILLISNYFLQRKDRFRKINIRVFNKTDILMFFIGVVSLMIGTIFKLKLIKIMFVFLINYKTITIILILLTYIFLIIFCIYILYKVGLEAYNTLKSKL